MRILSIIIAGIAGAIGLYAAFLWWKSSKVETLPLSAKHGYPQPMEPDAEQSDWTAGILVAAKESANLNKKAALWTAWAVGLATVASIISNLH